MRVTASHIVDWVKTQAKDTQQNLPRLIRRLCFDQASTKQVAFPAGDSTYVPGWDGITHSNLCDPWVPEGNAYWEIGCDVDITTKANRDFNKRTENTEENIRLESTFIFVSPRRWIKKKEWIKNKQLEKSWLDVRVYDADDLEQWLEQKPAITLQFSEELGLSGWGVMTPERYWNNWSKQCAPQILSDAFIGDRTKIQDEIKNKIITLLSQDHISHLQPLIISADSVEEASAFAAINVMAIPKAINETLVVSELEGWQFVEANPQLKIVIASNTEIASKAITREGLLLILPHAIGDLTTKHTGSECLLERPHIYEFEKSLIQLGIEESDAKRFAANSGRSWTVFHRQHSTNPSLRNPNWINEKVSSCLSVVCLVNAWNEKNEEDKKIIEQISGRSYEAIESDLYDLLSQDDSPVLHIGKVWKAKSPLELFGIYGGRIPSDQIVRFFTVAAEMLATPDPQLELPEKERWMAQEYGKTQPFSGLLFESICDSLMKLATRAPEHSGLKSLNIEQRVSHLVHELLGQADDVRWLSLSSYLPTLAEAAPDTFLKSVEDSLLSKDRYVTSLITETSDSGLMGRCWHAGLLWALEKLAWSPRRLARVAIVLAQLTHVPMTGNWGNKPSGSLLGLFRSWFPQTAADLPGRIQVLDLLIEKEPEAAYKLLKNLLARGSETASPAHRLNWRDDDAGVGHGVSNHERYEMLSAAKTRIIELSEGNAVRIASLFSDTSLNHHNEVAGLLPLLDQFKSEAANDDDREKLRASLRKIIHWHRNYDKAGPVELNKWLEPIEENYKQLAPKYIITKHQWLFDKYWLELPCRDRDDGRQHRQDLLIVERLNAINEIYQELGIAGIEELISSCQEPDTVGQMLTQVSWKDVLWTTWVIESGGDFTQGTPIYRCLSGYFHFLPMKDRTKILTELTVTGQSKDWELEKFARLLVLAQPERLIWDLVESCGEAVQEHYWQLVNLNMRTNEEDMEFVLEQLISVNRPLTALNCCRHDLNKTSVKQLYKLLQMFLQGMESDGPKLNSWEIGKMLERLETSAELDKMEIVQLEFALFPALRHGEEHNAKFLYEAVTSKPEIFCELITLAFKPEHGEIEELNEAAKQTAGTAYDILSDCTKIPGTLDNGSLDEQTIINFVDAVRNQARLDNRLESAERQLGQILAHSKAGENDQWPPLPLSKLLDNDELDPMRRGFITGTLKKRGVTSRSPYAGGDQERDLAQYYRGQAETIQYIFPNVSEMLQALSNHYDAYAKREDDDAGLRMESF